MGGGGGRLSIALPPTGNQIAIICLAERSGGCAGHPLPVGQAKDGHEAAVQGSGHAGDAASAAGAAAGFLQ